MQRPQPESYTPPPTRSASTEVRETGTKGRGRKDKSPTPAPPVPESAREEDPGTAESAGGETERPVDVGEPGSRFQKLYVSSPDGAQLQYMLEGQAGAATPLGERRLLLKMRRGGKDSGGEVSRLVTCEGVVMRLLEDGKTQVLFPDGTVAESCPGPAPEQPAAAEAVDSSPRTNRGGTGKSGRGDESPSRKSEFFLDFQRSKSDEFRRKGTFTFSPQASLIQIFAENCRMTNNCTLLFSLTAF